MHRSSVDDARASQLRYALCHYEVVPAEMTEELVANLVLD